MYHRPNSSSAVRHTTSRLWRRLLIVASVTTVAAGLTAPGLVAAAPTPTPVAPSAVQNTLPMQLVRVARTLSSIPDASGKVSVALADGTQIAIDASHQQLVMQHAAASAPLLTPNNRVTGNCGSSYIFVNYRSTGRPVHMDTGFDVNHLAIEYAWHAHIAGDSTTGYDYQYHASGGLNFRPGWHGQHSSHKDYPHGTYAAGVYRDGTSWAMLDTGDICVSGGPHDSRYL